MAKTKTKKTKKVRGRRYISPEERAKRKAQFDGRTFYLYRHLRNDNGKPFYIGQGSKPEKIKYPYQEFKRANQKEGHNEDWLRISKEAGGYTVEIILDNLTNDNIDDKEIEFIALYGRTINGGILCNQTDGGRWDYGGVIPKEVRAKIAEAQTMTVQDSIDKYVFPEVNTGCWLWAGCIDQHTNRMIISYQKKDGEARRIIYEYLNNVKTSKGEHVVSTCGCNICVNPDHAKIIVTPPSEGKNRRRGEAVWKSLLTEDRVKRIKTLHRQGTHTITKLAESFGVHRTTIGKIISGKNWAWVE